MISHDSHYHSDDGFQHGHEHSEMFGLSLIDDLQDAIEEAVSALAPGLLMPDEIAGDPDADGTHWHQQHASDTCAIASQEFILDRLTGYDFSEEHLVAEATAMGWYAPNYGTPIEHVGDLLELHGIPVIREFGVSIDEIADRLEVGEKIIVGVEAEQIWYPEYRDMLENCPWYPGQGANHAVEVIGVDRSEPANPVVILNDPGFPEGRELRVPADTFVAAHATSGSFTVTTAIHSHSVPSLGGYYNADGTYHYDSDNTDRDVQTGAIVRRW